jgi:Reverse transcriptase (RNA-dependent DNA polymerase)/RNase H-like domain found in reverse transcriptase/Integrase zinc binding domain/Integrase core domain
MVTTVIALNTLCLFYISVEDFNSFNYRAILRLLGEKFIYAIQSIAEYILLKTGAPTVKQLSAHDQTKDLATEDRIFQKRGTVLNLTKDSSKTQTHYKNFVILVNIFNLPNCLAELDSDSQVSLISQDYFENILKYKIKPYHFLDESPISFNGLGSTLRSKYPPLYLTLKIGAVLISARFHVSKELKSSPFLLGTDILELYNIHVVPIGKNKWELRIGLESSIKAAVPCKIISKDVGSNKCYVKRINLSDSMETEEISEPGFNVKIGIKKETKMEDELAFIINNSDIPEKYREDLIVTLKEIPNLYSGKEFSEIPFPGDIYKHDIEFTEDIKELYARPFPISGIRSEQLKETLEELCANGVLEPGDSPYVSPVFFILKKQNRDATACEGRLVFDYRRLNSYIRPLNHPLTNIKNFFDQCAKFKLFTLIDLRNAFLSIELTPRASERSAIITPYGVFKPKRSPFGLKTSPSSFCYALNIVLKDLPFCQFYMDDIIVGGYDEDDMTQKLKILFKRLARFNLKIQLNKIRFYQKELKILGVVFSAEGRKIDPAKVEAINTFPTPNCVKDVQRFLGMLTYVASFIPNYSTRMFPLFQLLKTSKKSFQMTQEALDAIQEVKEFLKKGTMLSNINFKSPLYIMTDASQVASGAFLYQCDIYEKNEESKNYLLERFGYIPENKNSVYLLPGMHPGKNTPVITEFAKDKENLILPETLDPTYTQTEKLKMLENKIVRIRPIFWFSKLFSEAQRERFTALEKEFLSLVNSVMYFRDYIEAVSTTYVLTDSQSLLWALAHKSDSLKLTRHLLKLHELNANIIFTHIVGTHNSVADYLSRICIVEEREAKDRDSSMTVKIREAHHILPNLPVLEPLTMSDIIDAFDGSVVQKCFDGKDCPLNVNRVLYRGIGPFKYTPTYVCESGGDGGGDPPRTLKINTTMSQYAVTERELKEQLNEINIYKHQCNDEAIQKIIDYITSPKLKKSTNRYFIKNDILMRTGGSSSEPDTIVLPEKLVPCALAYYHLLSHMGATKLYLTIKKKYCWPKMRQDCEVFVKGCILCSIVKSKTEGKVVIGTPRAITAPRSCWMIDQVVGLPMIEGYKSYLTLVDMYSTFVTVYPMKNGTSAEVAKIIDTVIIRNFGTPQAIFSDNAANLQGGEVKKLFDFYNISHTFSTPYSPTSHGLVENQNRTLTMLMNLFSEQYKTGWLHCITLAVRVINTLPRLSLLGKSPFFMMFGEEPQDIFIMPKNYFNMEESLKRKQNNVNFGKLIHRYLLLTRKQQNEKLIKKHLSYPINSLVYLKDFSKTPNRKTKPIYKKTPFRVIAEYLNVVYLEDILGRVSRHSKNNVKRCGERSEKLFSALPTRVKLALGDVMGLEQWENIKNTKLLPAYLEESQQDFVEPRTTRQNMMSDTHLLEQGVADPEPDPEHVRKEVYELEKLPLDKDIVKQLRELHDRELLLSDDIDLANIPALFKETVSQDPVRLPAGIETRNILPTRLRSQKTPEKEVTFNKEVEINEYEVEKED